MSKQTIIRLLIGLTFLIFLCPFFQTCSDKRILKQKEEKEITLFAANSLNKVTQNNVQTEAIPSKQQYIKKENSLTEQRKHNALSGYEMALYSFKKFEFQDLSDSAFYCFLCFFIVLIISVIQFYFSFLKKFKIIYVLGLINLVLVIYPMLIFYFALILEDINQIKYGYYLFIINTIVLLVLSKKMMKPDILT